MGSVVRIIPFTTTKSAIRFKNVVEIEPTNENGLTQKSIALVFQVMPIDLNRLLEKIGTISKNDLNRIVDQMVIMDRE